MRFRLLTLLFVITVFAVGFAVYRHQLDREDAIQQTVQKLRELDEFFARPEELLDVLLSLQDLGQADAIEALRRHHKLDLGSLKPEVIIPLLFERRNPSEKFPRRGGSIKIDEDGIPIITKSSKSFELAHEDWGRLDFVLMGDIPFRTDVLVGAISSFGIDMQYLIDWADQHGRMRSNPLTPSDDPFSQADNLIEILVQKEVDSKQPATLATLEFVKSLREQITPLVQRQVYGMIDHLISDKSSFRRDSPAETAELWWRIRKTCADRGMRWDVKTKQYVFHN